MTPRGRRTLRGELTFDGVGVHSGKRSSVKVSPLEEGRGINFAFGKERYLVSNAAADGSMRSTALTFPGGERVRTVEHLMAAIAGVGLDDVVITPDGDELPIMDGSPLLFAKAMMSEGFRESGEPYALPALAAPLCVDLGASSVAALPS